MVQLCPSSQFFPTASGQTIKCGRSGHCLTSKPKIEHIYARAHPWIQIWFSNISIPFSDSYLSVFFFQFNSYLLPPGKGKFGGKCGPGWTVSLRFLLRGWSFGGEGGNVGWVVSGPQSESALRHAAAAGLARISKIGSVFSHTTTSNHLPPPHHGGKNCFGCDLLMLLVLIAAAFFWEIAELSFEVKEGNFKEG